jgi:TusA-related sulfurtransferase
MPDPTDARDLRPDRTFDGGDLDCGSGLVLLIREQMMQVPPGGILELRSREPSVGGDLPPWCRMVGHEYLGVLSNGPEARYFVRRGTGSVEQEEEALEKDKERAKQYEWRARVRGTGPLRSTVYCRNFFWHVGQAASFEEKDAHPSSVEYLLGALGADLCSGFTSACARAGITLDDVELTVRGRLRNVLAHLGLEEGDPSFEKIEVKCFVSTPAVEDRVREVWSETLRRSPAAATLARATELEVRLGLV